MCQTSFIKTSTYIIFPFSSSLWMSFPYFFFLQMSDVSFLLSAPHICLVRISSNKTSCSRIILYYMNPQHTDTYSHRFSYNEYCSLSKFEWSILKISLKSTISWCFGKMEKNLTAEWKLKIDEYTDLMCVTEKDKINKSSGSCHPKL